MGASGIGFNNGVLDSATRPQIDNISIMSEAIPQQFHHGSTSKLRPTAAQGHSSKYFRPKAPNDLGSTSSKGLGSKFNQRNKFFMPIKDQLLAKEDTITQRSFSNSLKSTNTNN